MMSLGQAALHLVASKNNLDVARTLLGRERPASTRIRDKRGQYPIHRAAAVGSTPMISLLLEHKSPLDATDSSGYTALHHAIAEGHGALPDERWPDFCYT
jgi:26S proteasome non-ATPase regulatory subunit 10